MIEWKKADLHIHSALSPCADDEMTPNNIVNMAELIGLAVIAVTDHQAADNVIAVAQVAESHGIICLPGIEVQTVEEVHLLAYFPELSNLQRFAREVQVHLLDPRPASPYFGHQLIFNQRDQVVGEYPVLLQQSTALTIEQAWMRIEELEGCCIPAHVDRPAFSLLSQLGFLPQSLPIATVECTQSHHQKRRVKGIPASLLAIASSDAHALGQMITPGSSWLHATLSSPRAICQALRQGKRHLVQSYRPNF